MRIVWALFSTGLLGLLGIFEDPLGLVEGGLQLGDHRLGVLDGFVIHDARFQLVG